MNVNELLDTIEDLLEESTGMPLSGGKRIVDVEQIRDYLDDIRANLPVELRQAQSIVSDRAQLIESANAQAQAIVKKAEERARILVSEAEIVRAEWRDLGMPETLWNCRVKEFGPLIVSIDTEGNNWFEQQKVEFNKKKDAATEEICKQVGFIK